MADAGGLTDASTAGRAGGVTVPRVAVRLKEPGGPRRLGFLAGAFLLPALIFLGALVVYPIFFSIWRSLYDKIGDSFVGFDNYEAIFKSKTTLTAIRNTAIWVAVAPTVVTVLGLVFAVLTERVRWSTAFKVAVFMPMAISFLSAGVIWRLMYDQDPKLGLLNAAAQGISNVVSGPGRYPGARPSDEQLFTAQGKAFVTTRTFSPGETANLGLFAVAPEFVPEDAGKNPHPPAAGTQEISGVVWLDFTTGGGGETGVIDPTEIGLPGATVQALSDGDVVASATSGADGTYVLEGLENRGYRLRLAESTFKEPFGGFSFLGPTLITPAIMVAYIWIWAGFAMVVIGAGLAAIPRDVLEAARVDGASEWQVFRRVTVPLLGPVLAVVLVTLAINVLKIFDLVFVIAPGGSVRSANVIALEMWRTAFGGANDFGLGSALAVFLLVLVVPFMILNIRRFRVEG
jgi:alpha-glucoside transport system permease protein